jgi:hemoglobin
MIDLPITEDRIARLVPAFYHRVRRDEVLGPIFDAAIEDWTDHLERLQAFWSSVMLSSGRYKGQPMVAHLRHAEHMTPDNFARWLRLWRKTAEEQLGVEAAAAFVAKADRIAESLQLGVRFAAEGRVGSRRAEGSLDTA